jgi:NAD(P)-dependent dehydrogenase (short-subunit alcohol dehydrogenase family)
MTLFAAECFTATVITLEAMNQELAGKTVLITGASRGIGAATALTLAGAGASHVVLHYNSYAEGAEKTAAELKTQGVETTLVQADLSTSTGIAGLCSQVRTMKLDILINNAGHLVERARLAEFTEELFDKVSNLNVKSVYFVTQAAAPAMIERGSGIVINVSSIAARNGGGPGATIYAAAKASVAAITKGLAKELAPKGIRVNAVSPGTVDNYFHEKYSNRDILNSMLAQTPAGTLGTNEEVADTILFLCTSPSRYIHGQTIEINGGMYMV